MYYFKITESNKGLITSDAPLSGVNTVTKKIGSREFEIRQQAGNGNVKFGFTAISPEDGMALRAELQVGDEISSLEITDKKVKNQTTGVEFDNLYWAH
jgi:hypothetical protein